MTAIEVAQTQILEIVRSMEADRFQLLGVLTILPPSPAETDPLLDVEKSDLGTEIRTVIQCVLKDSFDSAIRNLRDIAELPAAAPEDPAG